MSNTIMKNNKNVFGENKTLHWTPLFFLFLGLAMLPMAAGIFFILESIPRISYHREYEMFLLGYGIFFILISFWVIFLARNELSDNNLRDEIVGPPPPYHPIVEFLFTREHGIRIALMFGSVSILMPILVILFANTYSARFTTETIANIITFIYAIAGGAGISFYKNWPGKTPSSIGVIYISAAFILITASTFWTPVIFNCFPGISMSVGPAI